VTGAPPDWDETRMLRKEEIYRLYFHGPAFQVMDGVCRSGDCLVGRLNMERPPLSADFPSPLNEPSLVELCMQTAGVWQIGKTGTLGLPFAIRSLAFYPQELIKGPLYAQVRPVTREDGQVSFDAQVVDDQGRLYLEMKGYRTAPLPYTADPELLRPLQNLVGA